VASEAYTSPRAILTNSRNSDTHICFSSCDDAQKKNTSPDFSIANADRTVSHPFRQLVGGGETERKRPERTLGRVFHIGNAQIRQRKRPSHLVDLALLTQHHQDIVERQHSPRIRLALVHVHQRPFQLQLSLWIEQIHSLHSAGR
jgi:hypothetical protein